MGLDKLEVILVDDEDNAREYLANLLGKYCPDVHILGMAASVSEAIELIKQHPPQLLFLDIEMPKENGFELLKKLETIPFSVVFVTAYEKYAIKAFKMSALDYLLKPIDLEDLQLVIEKAKVKSFHIANLQYKQFIQNITNKENPFSQVSIPVLNGFEFIHLDDIIYLKAESNYTQFFLKGGKHIMATKTLKEFEDVLNEVNFYRVHKSSMINLTALVKYTRGDGGMVLLIENHEVEVSRRAKEGFLERLNLLLIN